jgi:predicted aminopeptidase
MKFVALLLASLFLTSCQWGYFIHSGYYQAKLMNSRVPIEKILRSEKTTPEIKHKLELVQEAKKFAEEKLGLKRTRNYSSFVQLDGPYVSYVVQAAPAFELKPYLWKFPFVGAVPYKGYFTPEKAKEEAATFSRDEYDTYVRGVSAFSLLGWFRDPIYSSMVRYEDEDLVETIIHETVHATLYIKSNADFNERLATFLGQQGVKAFYLARDGAGSPALKRIDDDIHDQRVFSEFISAELKSLNTWYSEIAKEHSSAEKAAQKKMRLKEIQERFKTQVQPKFQTTGYKNFASQELNNAILLSYKTYLYDLSDFQKLFELKAHDFHELLEFCKSLEDKPDAEKALKEYLATTAPK